MHKLQVNYADPILPMKMEIKLLLRDQHEDIRLQDSKLCLSQESLEWTFLDTHNT